MKRWMLIFSLLSLPVLSFAGARNADTPMITAILEQGDGARVELRFRAIYWEPYAPGVNPAPTEGGNSFDTTLSPQIGELRTNVQLRIGNFPLDPGRYDFGFIPEEEKKWNLVISSGFDPIVMVPFQFEEDAKHSDFLSLVFTPGITSHDFNFVCRYGTLYHQKRWTITGVPTARTGSSTSTLPWTGGLTPQQDSMLQSGDLAIDSNRISNSPQIQSSTAFPFSVGANGGLIKMPRDSRISPREGFGAMLNRASRLSKQKADSGTFSPIQQRIQSQEK
ncbi:MAG: hypothetical protein C4527_24935 [Candidatus Omnitrophota bacterium]|jgi:hypothetical protein|nr:MAG: hypothetical protein C4527_24935 [Candidatus Omnitrophota bacterium]